VNVLNITTPSDIPSYVIQSESPALGYIVTNVYYVKPS
jgi:hypothetical protein